MEWICPACGEKNSAGILRCVCGYDRERSPEPAPNVSRSQRISYASQSRHTSALFPFGILLLVFGIIGFTFSLTMSTSVSTGIDGDFKLVNNIGLLNAKQNYIIVSSVLFAVGAFILTVSSLQSAKLRSYGSQDGLVEINADKDLDEVQSSEFSEIKECPICAEKIKARAIKCRFCGHEFGSG